ncbi:MAG: hypothetical protein EZS28_037698 [Streblomastix strix]|uniref:Uncharacterized protein n=1 Tax=Streblomastix strix TaxID=222440 RepID=A0A5J4U7E3_9EUKA|nr:MAG: hypothetical protein EZS28_037698 [Streblomastix strix]
MVGFGWLGWRGSYLEGINNSLLAQKLVATLGSYFHTRVSGQEITLSERYSVKINCIDLLTLNIDNFTNIATAFPTIEAAHTAMTGTKLQYAQQNTLLRTKPLNSLLVESLDQSQTHNRLQLI